MKLNLLPTHITLAKQVRTAWIMMVLVSILGILGAFGMIVVSTQQLDQAQATAEASSARVEEVRTAAKEANNIINSIGPIRKNILLAQAMNEHNQVYPNFYDKLLQFVPNFYRITQINATPVDAEKVNVQMQGVLKTYDQYIDLLLSLQRNPDVIGVTRSAYQFQDEIVVPKLTPQDQTGRPVEKGQGNIPDDGLDRLQYYISRGGGAREGASGNFGALDNDTRGAMPGYQTITVSMQVKGNLQTPDPRATIIGGGAAAN